MRVLKKILLWLLLVAVLAALIVGGAAAVGTVEFAVFCPAFSVWSTRNVYRLRLPFILPSLRDEVLRNSSVIWLQNAEMTHI